jgi:uncharacterized protein YxjI
MNSSFEVFYQQIQNAERLHIQQTLETLEIVTGIETRNKYQILDQDMQQLAFAAERSNGMADAFMRMILKHWRTFDMDVFNARREKILLLHFPFRWFFKTLEVRDVDGNILGSLQRRWAIFAKKFDVYDEHQKIVAIIESPLFKVWTFEFKMGPHKLGTLQKKWSGFLNEAFTDKDNFIVTYARPDLDGKTKILMLSMCLLVDIVYFENNEGKKSIFN